MDRKAAVSELIEGLYAMRKQLSPALHKPIVEKGLPTRAQFGILATIIQDGPQNLKELATRFCMSPSAATQLVHTLVRAKLLARKEDPRDRRRLCITITPEGKRRHKKLWTLHLEWFMALFSHVTDQELEQLKRIQQKITQHLRS